MSQETRPSKCISPFPISHVNAAAGVSELAPAPGNAQTYCVTGFYMTALTVSDGFSLLRRNCVKLISTSDYLTVTSTAALVPGTADFSVAVWVKIPTAITTIPKIYHKEDSSDVGVIIALAAGKVKVTIGDGTGADNVTVTSAHKINDDRWHLIVVACDRDVATGLYLYIDDRTVVATSDNDVTDIGDINNSTNITIYGVAAGDWYLGPMGYYEGGDGLLSAANVAALYNGGIGKKFSGLETGLAWAINCDEGIATTSYDVLGNSNASMTDTPEWPPFKASGSTAVDDTCGPPFDKEVMGFVGEFASGAITTQGGIPSVCMTFPEAIRIGRNNPLRILETDGSFDLILFGHPDGQS